MNLENKIALVTGAGQGIGKGCALELARNGVDLVRNYSSKALRTHFLTHRGLVPFSYRSNLNYDEFATLAEQGLTNPAAVAVGISEALITTATGLIVAIPAQLAYNWYTTKITRFVRDIETATNMLLETFAEMDGSGENKA